MPLVLIYIGSWLSITGGLYGLFSKAGDLLKKESREKLSRSIKGLDLPKRANWPEMFAELFDGVFGEKHLSFRCFFRSSIASLFSLVVVGMILEGVTRGKAEVFGLIPVYSGLVGPIVAIVFVVLIVLINTIPDYLSLYETRMMLNWLRRSASWRRVVFFLFLDVLLTSAIFAVIGVVSVSAVGGLWVLLLDYPASIYISYVLENIYVYVFGTASHGPMWSPTGYLAVFFYTTFFTSVWVWLYGLSTVTMRLLGKTRSGLHFFRRHFDLDEYPLRAMGFVVVIFITVVYLIALPFLLAG